MFELLGGVGVGDGSGMMAFLFFHVSESATEVGFLPEVLRRLRRSCAVHERRR